MANDDEAKIPPAPTRIPKTWEDVVEDAKLVDQYYASHWPFSARQVLMLNDELVRRDEEIFIFINKLEEALNLTLTRLELWDKREDRILRILKTWRSPEGSFLDKTIGPEGVGVWSADELEKITPQKPETPRSIDEGNLQLMSDAEVEALEDEVIQHDFTKQTDDTPE